MKKIAIFAISFSAIGYAQQPKAYNIEKDTLGLEEVVITANRIVEKKTNAVANVTVIDQKQLKEFIQIAPDLSQLIGMVEPALALSAIRLITVIRRCADEVCWCLLTEYPSLLL